MKAVTAHTSGLLTHSEELPLQTPSDFDQMQPQPPPEDTDEKKENCKTWTLSLFQKMLTHLMYFEYNYGQKLITVVRVCRYIPVLYFM